MDWSAASLGQPGGRCFRERPVPCLQTVPRPSSHAASASCHEEFTVPPVTWRSAAWARRPLASRQDRGNPLTRTVDHEQPQRDSLEPPARLRQDWSPMSNRPLDLSVSAVGPAGLPCRPQVNGYTLAGRTGHVMASTSRLSMRRIVGPAALGVALSCTACGDYAHAEVTAEGAAHQRDLINDGVESGHGWWIVYQRATGLSRIHYIELCALDRKSAANAAHARARLRTALAVVTSSRVVGLKTDPSCTVGTVRVENW